MQTIWIYSQDKGIEKYVMLIMKSGKITNNYQIKKESEHYKKSKITNIWEYLKQTPSNKWRWKKK